MSARELELRQLRMDDERSFLDAVAEFRSEQPPWDFALGYVQGETFEQYVRKHAASDYPLALSPEAST
jgi:hypothetical protein